MRKRTSQTSKRLREWYENPAAGVERHLMEEACDEIETLLAENFNLKEQIEAMKPHMPFAGVEPWPNDDRLDAEAFEQFWQCYPRRNGAKAGKVNARKQWAKLKPLEREAAAANLVLYTQAKSGYPEDAERYLRHRRWVGLEVETVADRNERVLAKAHRMADEMGMR